jgi:hypothetical protein
VSGSRDVAAIGAAAQATDHSVRGGRQGLADSRAARKQARIKALEAEKQRLLTESQAIVRRRQALVRAVVDPTDFEFQRVTRDGYSNQRALLKIEVDLESARRMNL